MRLPKDNEETLQRSVVKALRTLGYVVLVTTHRVKRCACGRWGRGDYGASKGVPDLLVTLAGWGNRWIGLECKGPKTKLSFEQSLVVDAGHVAVVRSIDDALAAVGWEG